ncbi:hypothetical protein QVD17_20684 [Tagetes erecta]|uniref:Uncharacterized protein n=1 Tax=Tagetes erecta TaxID=13708 RepID=A0AAD8KPL6_TARER|nr:hypothetical protein QVD17_20684 [Tagetes erecta]
MVARNDGVGICCRLRLIRISGSGTMMYFENEPKRPSQLPLIFLYSFFCQTIILCISRLEESINSKSLFYPSWFQSICLCTPSV